MGGVSFHASPVYVGLKRMAGKNIEPETMYIRGSGSKDDPVMILDRPVVEVTGDGSALSPLEII